MKWTVLTLAITTVMRLGGGLVLGNLLTPHDFGLAAIVFAVIFGIEMMTDGGAVISLIRSKRTDDAWLNTVWSFQITRSLLICAVSMIAAKPLANFFEEPQLFPMLVFIGLLPICDAFVSTSANMALRDLQLKRYSYLEIGSILASYCVTMPLAYFYQTPWALVIGAVINTFAHAVLSFLLFPHRPHRFRFEKEALKELLGFGLWLTFTSTIGFVLLQGDRLIIGKALGTESLGVYAIAATWSVALADVSIRIIMRVFVPMFAEVYRQDGHTQRISELRKQVLLAAMLPLAAVSSLGQQIVHFLYPPIMAPAGPLLQILIVGVWFALLDTLYHHQFLVQGKSDRRIYGQIASICLLFILLFMYWGDYTVAHLTTIFVAGIAMRTLVMGAMAHWVKPTGAATDVLLTLVFLGLVVAFSYVTDWLATVTGDFGVMAMLGFAIALPSLALAWHAWKQSNRWFANQAG